MRNKRMKEKRLKIVRTANHKESDYCPCCGAGDVNMELMESKIIGNFWQCACFVCGVRWLWPARFDGSLSVHKVRRKRTKTANQ